ncbi:MAG: response regulator, partial [bacterium]
MLVVDDDEMSRRLLRDLLAAHGYRLSEAVDGEDAMRQIEANLPDLILLDVMLPKLDGIEICRGLKSNERTAPIPVLLVTALHDRSDRLRGIASGATDFITKPVDTAEVLLRVRNALRTKRLYDQSNALLRLKDSLSDMIVHDDQSNALLRLKDSLSDMIV